MVGEAGAVEVVISTAGEEVGVEAFEDMDESDT